VTTSHVHVHGAYSAYAVGLIIGLAASILY